jgi:putative transposase
MSHHASGPDFGFPFRQFLPTPWRTRRGYSRRPMWLPRRSSQIRTKAELSPHIAPTKTAAHLHEGARRPAGCMSWRHDFPKRICLGRLRSVSIASIAFDVFPRVFFNSGVLLSLETEPKQAQKHRVLRQFRDSKKRVHHVGRGRCVSAFAKQQLCFALALWNERDGRGFRTLNIVDDFTRECVAIEADRSLPGLRVTRVLDRLHGMVGLPKAIVVDNGPEFAGRRLDALAYTRGVALHFIRPGKPIESAYVESFNGKFRDECLNEHWFISLADAKAAIEAWRITRPCGRTVRSPGVHRTNEALKPEDLALSV